MKFKKFIKSIWEFPQNALGFIIKTICKTPHYTTYKDANVFSWKNKGAMSLGKYIFAPFVDEDPMTFGVQQCIKHEYGHTVQSKYLGWFYLLVIGLPSLVWAGCFKWYRKKTGMSYYDFYTESSADRLGEVHRED